SSRPFIRRARGRMHPCKPPNNAHRLRAAPSWPCASGICCRHGSTSWRGGPRARPLWGSRGGPRGVGLPPRGAGASRSRGRGAGRLGLDAVGAGDSLRARPRHEPLTLLAAVAGRLGRVQIGTAVLLPALRNPVVLAHQVATLDQVAEGRLILGVGIAADVANIRQEFTAAGVPFEKRVGRLLEGLRLARLLWSGKPVDWDGRWKV